MNTLKKSQLIKKINKSEQKDQIIKTVKLLQNLRENGYTDEMINEVIISNKFPLSFHLFITANYTDLMSLSFR